MMMRVPVSRPLVGQEEAELAREAVARGDISGIFGAYLQEFEQSYAAYCGTKYAITVSNGTTALHLALATLGIGAGDEVLVSSFTNMATFFAVLYQGAVPIPIDIEEDTWNIDPSLLESKITSRTKAILVVHIYGHPVDMDPVLEIAKNHNLFVVEDVAEAHGAEYKGRRTGSLGDIGCHSFYANKIITTGEGGMLTLNNDELCERAKSLKSLAFGKQNKFLHDDIGYNYRLTNVQCAIGVAQLRKIDEILRRKQEMASYYLEAFSGMEDVVLPVQREYAKNVYWMFLLVLTGSLSGKRSQIMAALKERGIESRESFIPYDQQEVIFQKHGMVKPQACPVADRIGANGFYIPSGTDISNEELAYTAQHVKEVIGLCRAS
ncbi:MAG: DegT/DnrJ/EryC1/StrS family aminotransferase [Candidatus Uhrbacteria bacterium]